MNKKLYTDSFNMLRFSANFDEKTIEKMQVAAKQTREDRGAVRHTKQDRFSAASAKKGFKWRCAVIPVLTCALAAAAIFVLPMLLRPAFMQTTTIDTLPDTTESENLSAAESTAIAETAVIETNPDYEAITVVDPKQYQGLIVDYLLLEAGEVIIDENVVRAIDDSSTDDKYFFVDLCLRMDMSKTVIGKIDDYVYKGRTISEWRILTDLANETYPYNEYNGDMGGNITREEYDAAIAEAKTLDAEENQDAAVAEYNAAYDANYPEMEASRIEILTAECNKLQEQGYDVRLYDTWTYYGDAQKEDQTILAGLFSKEELLKLRDERDKSEASMIISWIKNGDGLEKWDSSKWN